jgi:hypothetical protein
VYGNRFDEIKESQYFPCHPLFQYHPDSTYHSSPFLLVDLTDRSPPNALGFNVG